ncbi:helix-turn-helix domain-containing protein [Mucilaginibacter pallidiroseus]|uniref:Helix-turn-helix domain-containing protein n=1 Tax=Mucilaginibacter pallidiroseus TaxID=2599295 RepID=A0A563UBX8_9SPHI|nr:helix-turn-helix domain-containing protein [Mucilaginibacter pallidiroseus]TWR28830.1 helix-turn-helix domain-containing protein [Mucilaginibacter pallidiroseus]
MRMQQPYRIRTIKEYHKILGIGSPQHPMVSVINLNEITPYKGEENIKVIFDFYLISLKKVDAGRVHFGYGQQQYDFDNGVLFFIAPNQVFTFSADQDFKSSGVMLLIHPDILWGFPLLEAIKKFEFFNYEINEALFVSEKEETILVSFIKNIEQEYHSHIDKFSDAIIISQIESLLSYADRFYTRQFLTRKRSGSQLLDKLENLLNNYFDGDDIARKGLPTVQYVAGLLNCSPNYLSGVLKTHTGQNTQQHIHNKVVEKAKEKLSITTLTVSEIAFELGFEYPQSFSKLFKSKTQLSPIAYRASFN